MFSDEYNIVDEDDIPYDRAKRWCIGVDYGTGNATVFLLGFVDDEDNIYICREYYFAGRQEAQESGNFESQKTDLEFTEDMRNFILSNYDITGLTYRDIDIMVDPAAASFILQMRRFHMKSKRATNEVLDGIRNVATYIAERKLKVSSECVHLIEELHTYSWDEKAQARGQDVPLKVNDHCIIGDTLVKTDNGYVKIEDLVGTEGMLYTINNEGNIIHKKYSNVRKTRENAEVITLIFENGEELTLTPDHLILTDSGWTEAQYISEYNNIITLNSIIKIVEKKKHKKCDVYNMEVDDVHCFSVTTSNVIIHNCVDALRYNVMKLKAKSKISSATRNLGL